MSRKRTSDTEDRLATCARIYAEHPENEVAWRKLCEAAEAYAKGKVPEYKTVAHGVVDFGSAFRQWAHEMRQPPPASPRADYNSYVEEHLRNAGANRKRAQARTQEDYSSAGPWGPVAESQEQHRRNEFQRNESARAKAKGVGRPHVLQCPRCGGPMVSGTIGNGHLVAIDVGTLRPDDHWNTLGQFFWEAHHVRHRCPGEAPRPSPWPHPF